MDFSTRNNQQSPAAPRPGTNFTGGDAPARKEGRSGKRLVNSKWTKWGGLLLLVAVAVLLLAVIWILINGGSTKAESSYVDSSKLQAVFLSNDQVYFGHISELNGKFVALNNIYYLQTQNSGTTTTTTSSNNVSLVKLGCELHKPYDRMIINRSEVEFWENLQSDGQVANAVKQYQQNNPNGQKCSNTTTNGTSSTNVQGTTSTPTTNSTTNSTSTTKKQ
jgi:FlaG/FlaF family flagellin (archaellin)